jgi:transposase
MDVHLCNDLCSQPEASGPEASVPVSLPVIVGGDAPDDADADRLTVLWQCYRLLARLFFVAVAALRRLQAQVLELRQQAGYWQAQHQRAVVREEKAAEESQRLQGELRELKRRVFGRRSETSSATNPQNPSQTGPNGPAKRPRGQQRGAKGHGRRNHDHLPTTDENCTLADDQKCCPCCQQPFEEIPGTADGDILEIDVRGHRRRYHRKRYRRCCQCPGTPALLTAPPPDKLIPKSNLGISVWVMILQHKFAFFQPLYRILAELRSAGLELSAGTLTGGLQKLVPLLQPLYELLVEHNRGEAHWHCDETRWPVFVKHQDKANFTWYLWVFAGHEAIVFVLDPTRAHDVPEDHFGADAHGIASVDRYSAYKAMAQVKAGLIILAFCWAHVRRDFLAVFTGWPELTDWAWSWVEEIGTLYDRNDQRLSVQEDPTAFAQADRLVRDQVEHLRERRDTELARPDLRPPQRKALTSLVAHWSGLTVFVDHPEVPMDNNTGERCNRGPAVARKNFYGSGSLWSGRLAAMLFSLFQTVQLWGLDIGKWLTAYLTACAKAGGQPPPDPQRFLPWNMTPAERDRLSLPTAKPPDPKPPPAADTATDTLAVT